jgi:mRNA interferase MazF
VICDRHDVVVVPFPFHEIDVKKRRPALVISSLHFNETNGWTVVAMITTAKKTSWPSDFGISDLEATGLSVPSIVRCRLQTLPNDILIRKIGRLGAIDRMMAERQLAKATA